LKVFVTRWFERFARKEKISAARFCEAVARAERGLIDAELGGGLIKQRIARKGEGRSGGYRTVIAYRTKDRAIFLYGFAKNERENVGGDDLEDLKKTAAIFLAFGKDDLAQAVAAGQLKEIVCNA
jgi:hypothetical protein